MQAIFVAAHIVGFSNDDVVFAAGAAVAVEVGDCGEGEEWEGQECGWRGWEMHCDGGEGGLGSGFDELVRWLQRIDNAGT